VGISSPVEMTRDGILEHHFDKCPETSTKNAVQEFYLRAVMFLLFGSCMGD
jgi:hypothetical protein